MSRAQKIEPEGLLRSEDNVTGPVSVSAGDHDTYRVSLAMPEKAFFMLEEMALASGQNVPDVISKALILYKVSAEAVREGKAVGIASTPDVLETEFVGL